MHPDTRLLKARGGSAAEPRQQPPACSCVGLGAPLPCRVVDPIPQTYRFVRVTTRTGHPPRNEVFVFKFCGYTR